MSIGRIWPSEMIEVQDPLSGIALRQLTNYRAHSHHFYFTNPGWYDGGRRLLVASDRDNRTNLFGLELHSGQIQQLTDLNPLPLPREVEFLRACVSGTGDEAYFWYGMELRVLNLHGLETRVIYRMEDGWDVSMINCSADGRHVYASVSEDMSSRFRVDYLRGYVGFRETWAARPLSQILRIAVDGSGGQTLFEESYWIGHVNTSPTRNELLTFCHEGPWNEVDNRIWGINVETGEVWKIRARQEEGEAVGHEYWHADGERIGYHGRRVDGTQFIGHVRYDDLDPTETAFPGKTGHIHSNGPELIVGDGGRVVRLWQRQGDGYGAPRALCCHDSSMKIQQLHVHPRFSPYGTHVLFTSDVSGYGNVYLAEVPDVASLPEVKD